MGAGALRAPPRRRADAHARPAARCPRRARDFPLYRLAERHHETFKQVYDERFASHNGAWRGVVERTLFDFLDCGIEEHAFARVCCDACRREFRVALSCKRPGFCPSYYAKRAGLWAERLATQVLAPVDHHQSVVHGAEAAAGVVLYDRRRFGPLSCCAWRTVRGLYRARLLERRALPGMVVSIQTYGDLANWQPRLHALVSARGEVGVEDGSRRAWRNGFCPGDTPVFRCTTPSGRSLRTPRGSSGCSGTWCIRRSRWGG